MAGAAMMWTRMPGQTWLGAAASFLAMWVVMMVVMMLPSLVPALSHYRIALRRDGRAHAGRQAALVALGYFLVWSALGAIVFPVGATLAAITAGEPAWARVEPIAGGLVMLMVGVAQFSARRRHGSLSVAGPAWRDGVRLGVRCVGSCSALMTAAMVMGSMNIGVMAMVTVAITVERLAKNPTIVARYTGIGAIGVGVFRIAVAVTGS